MRAFAVMKMQKLASFLLSLLSKLILSCRRKNWMGRKTLLKQMAAIKMGTVLVIQL
jgi:hypothetical protein